MKIKKIVKYNYELEEEDLEKDIDKFIDKAKKGNYQMDGHYGNEGLKILKQYFRILKDKLKNNEYEECKNCYHKLIIFSIKASGGRHDNLFDYEDLLAKINKDFDNLVKNYFICLIKTSDINELSKKVSEYASCLDIYGFDSDKEVLLNNLTKEQFNLFEEKMLEKTIGMTKNDEDKQDIIYFLMRIAEIQDDKEKYLKLCERFKGIYNDKEFENLKNEYEENKIFLEKVKFAHNKEEGF